jgi:hypothetical protein
MDSGSPTEGDTDYEYYTLTLGNLYTTQPVHDITDRTRWLIELIFRPRQIQQVL